MIETVELVALRMTVDTECLQRHMRLTTTT